MMRKSGVCPKCGSNSITLNASVGASFASVYVAKLRKPNRIGFESHCASLIEADFCNDCGFMELYVVEPEKFLNI